MDIKQKYYNIIKSSLSPNKKFTFTPKAFSRNHHNSRNDSYKKIKNRVLNNNEKDNKFITTYSLLPNVTSRNFWPNFNPLNNDSNIINSNRTPKKIKGDLLTYDLCFKKLNDTLNLNPYNKNIK